MHRVALLLTWLSASAAVGAFFMPWVHLERREPALAVPIGRAAHARPARGRAGNATQRISVEVRRGTTTVASDLRTLAELPPTIAGVEIPRLADTPQAQVVEALWELLTGQPQHLNLKRWVVYLVPGIALLAAALLTLLSRRKRMAFGVALLCLLLAGAWTWKLLSASRTTPLVTIRIGLGLWVSVWAYGGLALAAGGLSLCSEPAFSADRRAD